MSRAGVRRRKPIEWTEAHRREMLACLCRIGENAALRGDRDTARKANTWAILGGIDDETAARHALADLLNGKVVDREVRRVDGLATGRLVRETGWRGCARDGRTLAWTMRADTAQRWRETGTRVVCVTRIRRAP